ncbi:DUF3159 domain-containing protein [Corynebacterium guangdongense]|uniref:DUF3159 domain-containing protein n=1 Tax=Corynebacterium guangdongense TaxID=1783348 RepID=A0ABU1ZXA5_9CORY|nr:DUF3159 domain-containing protein [Corynebacterium guangdongense]MDR7329485.1 hypothetical protein [Corynebacterium guangdongense]WJZ18050.1 hypothetical protein CGUA_07440 [Corynebacterium guangdongense]
MTSTSESTGTEPTLLEQMGGVTGLIASTLPVLVLVPVNNYLGLGWALGAALGVAFLIFLWRAFRRESLQPAVNALVGVLFGAAIAWFVGDAKGYFLYGIWASLVLAVVAIGSVLVRWPIVGVIWKGLNGEDMVWRRVVKARRSFAWATLGWATVFISRFLVQNAFYNSDATNALAVARILMGWPLTGVVLLLTVWMVRRANAAVEEAETAGLVPTTLVVGDDADHPAAAQTEAESEAETKETPHERHHP